MLGCVCIACRNAAAGPDPAATVARGSGRDAGWCNAAGSEHTGRANGDPADWRPRRTDGAVGAWPAADCDADGPAGAPGAAGRRPRRTQHDPRAGPPGRAGAAGPSRHLWRADADRHPVPTTEQRGPPSLRTRGSARQTTKLRCAASRRFALRTLHMHILQSWCDAQAMATRTERMARLMARRTAMAMAKAARVMAIEYKWFCVLLSFKPETTCIRLYSSAIVVAVHLIE